MSCSLRTTWSCEAPIVGVNFDNIYTETSSFTLYGSLRGLAPRNLFGPLTQTDTIIVP